VHNKSSEKESPIYLQREQMRQIMKLLIVEDNAGMRRLIKSVVFDLADDVVECEDGADALQAYADFLPDWVLMDIKMPKVDGLTASLAILAAYPDAHICMVTDYGDQKTREAASAAGACAYVLKEELYQLRAIISSGTPS
jgi:CheY-like chemotaxis protein